MSWYQGLLLNDTCLQRRPASPGITPWVSICAALLAVLVFACSTLTGQEYHVSPTGSDSEDGSRSQTWKTIIRATATLNSGDTAIVHAGTYALSQQLGFAHSGTGVAPIRLLANEGDEVVISGGSDSCVSLQFRSCITFEGLTFTTDPSIVGASMVYMEATNYCSFITCRFRDMPTQVGSENIAAIGCMGTENGFSTACVFRNNLFDNNAAPAMRLYDTDGWIIEHNEFRNCQQAVGGKYQPFNMIVGHNLIVGGQLAFYFAGQGGCSSVAIYENIVIGAEEGFQLGGLGADSALRDNIRLYNNTFVDCRNFLNGWDDGFTRRQHYKNILCAGQAANISGGTDVAGRFLNIDKYGSILISKANYDIDWNCRSIPTNDCSLRFVNASIHSTSLTDWQSRTDFEDNSITSAPHFISRFGT